MYNIRQKLATKSRSKHHTRGASHELVIIGVVLVGIAGALSFVAYNTWQKKSAEAGNAPMIVRVATYNILSQTWDGQTIRDTWQVRKPRVSSKISAWNPGIIGMQEVTHKHPNKKGYSTQRNDVIKFMNAKGYTGYVGAADNSDPIFYKRGVFTLAARGQVKIVASSPSAKAPAARYLTWVRLIKDKKSILVLNYHFNDRRLQTSQVSKLTEIISKARQKNDHVVFTGDFNRYAGTIAKATRLSILDDAKSVDHILGSGNVRKVKPQEKNDTGRGNPAASDHSLVGVRIYVY